MWTAHEVRHLAATIGVGALSQERVSNRAVLKECHDALRAFADLIDVVNLLREHEQRGAETKH